MHNNSPCMRNWTSFLLDIDLVPEADHQKRVGMHWWICHRLQHRWADHLETANPWTSTRCNIRRVKLDKIAKRDFVSFQKFNLFYTKITRLMVENEIPSAIVYGYLHKLKDWDITLTSIAIFYALTIQLDKENAFHSDDQLIRVSSCHKHKRWKISKNIFMEGE